jgi:SAM-dependent methyltransferase
MLLPNNPELDPEKINKKLKEIASSRRRAAPLFDTPKITSAPTALGTGAGSGQRLRDVIKSIPLLGPVTLRAYRLYRNLRMSGLNRRQRILLLPAIGPLARWSYNLLRINKAWHEIAVLHQLQREHHAHMLARLEELNELRARFDATAAELRQQQQRLATLDERMARQESCDLPARAHRLEAELDALRARSSEAHNLIAGLRQTLHQRPAAPPVAADTVAPAIDADDAAGFDQAGFYLEFENQFRGSRDDIRERLKVYLPTMARFANDDSALVIDVGSGRGEWLGYLQENGIRAKGIDLNEAMVAVCREQGLQAEAGDAIACLRRQPPGSVAAVTGFHIIEHLPFAALIALFDAALQALRPDGVIIFETPNPENLAVGACNFYYDPTHRSPIPPLLAEFIARQRGFARAEILRLHPYPEDHRLQEDSEAARRINDALYGPQDYALLAWKTHAD